MDGPPGGEDLAWVRIAEQLRHLTSSAPTGLERSESQACVRAELGVVSERLVEGGPARIRPATRAASASSALLGRRGTRLTTSSSGLRPSSCWSLKQSSRVSAATTGSAVVTTTRALLVEERTSSRIARHILAAGPTRRKRSAALGTRSQSTACPVAGRSTNTRAPACPAMARTRSSATSSRTAGTACSTRRMARWRTIKRASSLLASISPIDPASASM